MVVAAQADTAPRTPVWAPTPVRVVVYLGVATFALIAALLFANKGFIDLAVYRDAGRAWLDDVPLYDFSSVGGLHFIYGPFAAVAFAPLTWLSDDQLQTVWTGVSVFLLWWVLRTVLDRLGLAGPSVTALNVLAPALLIAPVRETLSYGQINIVLMALVVLDVLGVIPPRLRGVGIGIAAAIKVTPAAFGLLLLVRKDYPSIVRAAGGFLAVGAVGWVFDPSDSRQYWTSEFFNTDRAGNHLYGPNQAVTGLLVRLGLDATMQTAVWLVSAVVIVAAAAYAARRFTVAGQDVPALGVVALASLLAAPFAVSHHWVYVVLLLPLLLAPEFARWRYVLAVVAGVFYLGMYDYVPVGDNREAHWSIVQQVAGNSECFAGLALLAAAVVAARRRTPIPDDVVTTGVAERAV